LCCARCKTMRVVAFRISEEELRIVARGLFKSRSDAIRSAIRKLLEEMVW
jgi:Arc/MetJ-type ribon-helix-helix transcriptional regulator